MSKKKRQRAGRKFKISPLYLCMAAVFYFNGAIYDFIIYTVAMGLHEMAHAEVSQRLGYQLISFKLMPYGASLTGNYEGIKHTDEISIAIAGPLLNLVLATITVALWWLIPQSYFITQSFAAANLMIAAFNCLPVFPLDGGRILLSVLSQKIPKNIAFKKLRIIGFVFSFIFLGLFILSIFYKFNISFAATGLFMVMSSIIPDKSSRYQRLYSMAYRSEIIKRGLPVKEMIVSNDSTIIQLSRLLNGNYFTKFTIVGKDFVPLFSLTETEIEKLTLTHNSTDKITDILKNKTLNIKNQKINPL